MEFWFTIRYVPNYPNFNRSFLSYAVRSFKILLYAGTLKKKPNFTSAQGGVIKRCFRLPAGNQFKIFTSETARKTFAIINVLEP